MSEYRVRVRGPGGIWGGNVLLDCDSDAQAISLAAAIESPFGHDLCAGDKFLCAFEASWGVGFPDVSEADS
jgi:hypothetical protein